MEWTRRVEVARLLSPCPATPDVPHGLLTNTVFPGHGDAGQLPTTNFTGFFEFEDFNGLLAIENSTGFGRHFVK